MSKSTFKAKTAANVCRHLVRSHVQVMLEYVSVADNFPQGTEESQDSTITFKHVELAV
jgi:hypothetical protein